MFLFDAYVCSQSHERNTPFLILILLNTISLLFSSFLLIKAIVEEEKNFIELLLDAAWEEDDVDVKMVKRLEIYAAAYKEWLPIKAKYDKAKQDRDSDMVSQLKPFIQKGFPQTLEEFEAATQVSNKHIQR
jgi:hypothetical protein